MCPNQLQHRPELGLWQSHSPALSLELLETPGLAVRPPGQPVPPHLQGSRLGTLFARWLRQRDDEGRVLPKAALSRALTDVCAADLAGHARRQAALARPGGWDHWVWASPVAAVASLLGLAMDGLPAQRCLRRQMQALAAALAGGPPDAADVACEALLAALNKADARAPLQAALARHASPAVWRDAEDFEANRLALLWQSYEAGAALLGKALVRLTEQPALRRPGQMSAWLPALVGGGGAVLNTQRFTRCALTWGGTALPAGAKLLLNLTGADAADIGFGAGPHRCPGQDLALGAAAAALEDLMATDAPDWPRQWRAQPRPNALTHRFCPENRPDDCRDL
jgi:hypothetical protein